MENQDTGTKTRLVANATGHFEANLLLPGKYKVVAEARGFKRSIRSGIILPLSTRLEIDLKLEIGTVSDSVTVTGETPMLDTNSASSGMVMDNRSIMDLPVIANNIMVMVKMTPGVQTSGVNDYLGPHSNVGASDYRVAGGVGGNEWSIDGVPNNGASRRSAYLPVSDTIQEMKVETFGFDASSGHSTGVTVTMMTKGGTNQFHGTLTEQHWQQRWHGTPFFTKQRYYRNIAAAEAGGDRAGADALRSQDKQATGRSNNYTGTIGGPIKIPKLFDGKDKLFFFFSYQGNKDKVADLPDRLNKTIPTLADRKGDFSRFLGVNAGLYQLYDPLSVRSDPARPTHLIRDPIPGNILAASRIVNPAAAFYNKLLPPPNNDVDLKREPTNNFLALTTPSSATISPTAIESTTNSPLDIASSVAGATTTGSTTPTIGCTIPSAACKPITPSAPTSGPPSTGCMPPIHQRSSTFPFRSITIAKVPPPLSLASTNPPKRVSPPISIPRPGP